MPTFVIGQKVRHIKIAVVMEVVGIAGLGGVSKANGYKASAGLSEEKIVCKYIKNGRSVEKLFKSSELKPA